MNDAQEEMIRHQHATIDSIKKENAALYRTIDEMRRPDSCCPPGNDGPVQSMTGQPATARSLILELVKQKQREIAQLQYLAKQLPEGFPHEADHILCEMICAYAKR
jgi:hypothetical protein